MYSIEIKSLTKRYRDITAVDGINLTVNEGELFSLLGVNGAGKTTTIKMLSGLTDPTSGDAILNGHSIIDGKASVKAIIGISPQETAVAPNLTVRENLEFIAGIHGFKSKESKERATEMIEKFSLGKIASKKAGRLSGGWQRRLSIAMALISDPEILFLDEPTLGLDVIARAELWKIIRELKGKITIILTTHYMEESEALSDRLAVMKNGKIITVGTVSKILEETGTEKLEDAFIKLVTEAEA